MQVIKVLGRRRWWIRLGWLLGALLWGEAAALEGAWVQGAVSTVRVLSVDEGIAPAQRQVSVGLEIEMPEGWHTYWHTVGRYGLPPRLEDAGSENLGDIQWHWPTPERIESLGEVTAGYRERVVFPLTLTLERAGAGLEFRQRLRILVCEKICVPDEMLVHLALPAQRHPEMDTAVGHRLALVRAQEPAALPVGGWLESVQVEGDGLMVRLREEAEMVLALDAGGLHVAGRRDARTYTLAGVALPVTLMVGQDSLGQGTGGLQGRISAPFGAGPGLLWILLLAFAGGMVLNVLPCVLPVLALKLSALTGEAQLTRERVRRGFVLNGLGIMLFFLMLAAVLLAVKAAGGVIGWGVQFQHPMVLQGMIVVLVLFASHAVGLWSVPQVGEVRTHSWGGGLKDVALGFFVAVLATPCTAPFLGTAVAFALLGSGVETMVIFLALGAGLAVPYALAALFPGVVLYLPRPGRWQVWWARGLAAGLVLTAAWLAWVLSRHVEVWVLGLGLVVVSLIPLAVSRRRWLGFAVGVCAVALVAVLATPQDDGGVQSSAWETYSPQRLSELMAQQEVVLVTVGADWCVTCQYNDWVVLSRAPVRTWVEGGALRILRADWTLPDAEIAGYLESFGRYGIPLNVLYGPGAPQGVLLGEILTPGALRTAMTKVSAEDYGSD